HDLDNEISLCFDLKDNNDTEEVIQAIKRNADAATLNNIEDITYNYACMPEYDNFIQIKLYSIMKLGK
ncbi:hypothetical protein HK096_010704, partial [Nowakowskiella sp. JEL0078]